MSESRSPKLRKFDRNLTDFCHFGQIIVNSDIFCQLSVILDNFLSIFCSLGHLDSDMFLSIRPLFPCSGCSGPTAIGFSAIASCSNLKSLDLSYTPVDDLSLVTIANKAQHLKQLIIAKCEAITNMSVVARFTSLESLILDQCSFVTDEGLDIPSIKCNRLTHLSLAFTRVTDTGLGYMSKCQMLQDLRIPYCKGVQGEGVIIIAKACGWFHHVVLSHRFRGSRIVDTFKQLCCTVHLEMDELALVPFDANLLFI
jgi:hypothetical protein